MSVYLVVALALLLAVLFLVLRPFLLATVEAAPLPAATVDPAARAQAAARVEQVARAARRETQPPDGATAGPVDTDAAATAQVVTAAAPGTDDPTDVRARVEAAIAARKAALRHRRCANCEGTIEEGDAFCRSCGTRVAE